MFFKHHKKLIFIVATLSVAFLVFPAIQPADAALVPCGRLQDDPSTPEDETERCEVCDLLSLASRVINFILFTLVPAIAVLLYLIAGFMILLGGANPSWVGTGINIFKTTTWGVIIIFGAWMITNTTLKSIAGNSLYTKDWNKVTCTQQAPVVQPPPVQPPVVGGDLQRLALAVLNSEIKLSSSANCGNSFHARQNVQDIAGGKLAAVCSPTCSCAAGGSSGDIDLNPKILEGLLELNNWMKTQGIPGGFTITSLMTGKHSANSAHYTGQAVDIVPGSTNRADWQRIRSFLNGYGGTAICEGSNGADVTSCSGVNHIHWTFRF